MPGYCLRCFQSSGLRSLSLVSLAFELVSRSSGATLGAFLATGMGKNWELRQQRVHPFRYLLSQRPAGGWRRPALQKLEKSAFRGIQRNSRFLFTNIALVSLAGALLGPPKISTIKFDDNSLFSLLLAHLVSAPDFFPSFAAFSRASMVSALLLDSLKRFYHPIMGKYFPLAFLNHLFGKFLIDSANLSLERVLGINGKSLNSTESLRARGFGRVNRFLRLIRKSLIRLLLLWLLFALQAPQDSSRFCLFNLSNLY